VTAADPVAFVRSLRAVRSYRPDSVPPETVAELLEVARWTGSAHNEQPWEVIVVRDRVTLDALAAAGTWTKHLAGAPLGIALVLPGVDPLTEAFDEGRLTERIMLAALGRGVGSCIAWFDEPEGAIERARRLLGVPPDRTLRTVLALGYPEDRRVSSAGNPGPARKPVAAFVHDEHYGRR